MKTSKYALVGLVSLLSCAAFAQDRVVRPADNAQVQLDRNELSKARVELKDAKAKVKQDKVAGNQDQLQKDRVEFKKARHNTRMAKRRLHKDIRGEAKTTQTS